MTSIVAQIFDVSKDMPLSILADEIAQIRAESHVSDGRLLIPPSLDRKAFEEDEAFSIQKLVTDRLKEAGEAWKREIALQKPSVGPSLRHRYPSKPS